MLLNHNQIIELIENEVLNTIQNSFKDNLLSVMLYGSILTDSYTPGISDINILIILENVKVQQLENFTKSSYKLIRKHKITPLILSRNEFINSADVFPLEYFDIKEKNRVIYGEDETKNLKITDTNLRHQIESGLRGNLTRLRQAIIASKAKDQVMKGFFKVWMGSILSMFRGLIRLKKETVVNLNHDEIIEKVGKLYGINPEVFKDIFHLRQKGKELSLKDLTSYVHEELKKLIAIIDKLDFNG